VWLRLHFQEHNWGWGPGWAPWGETLAELVFELANMVQEGMVESLWRARGRNAASIPARSAYTMIPTAWSSGVATAITPTAFRSGACAPGDRGSCRDRSRPITYRMLFPP
jgi:hypothetical protein